jgi:ferric-dicitrate binding protein FerR (iron transport regulator)
LLLTKAILNRLINSLIKRDGGREMIDAKYSDAAWKQAVDWIMQEHESSFDDAARATLRHWLAESPMHQKAYQQARTLWLVTGLIPALDERDDLSSGNN